MLLPDDVLKTPRAVFAGGNDKVAHASQKYNCSAEKWKIKPGKLLTVMKSY
jgi:hypothetical protein